MTGLHDTDIRLNDEWALTQAADGDAPLCSGLECLYQNIILEALTQPGDLFYDASFGWGLREKNNVDLWRELKNSKYTPGPYHSTVITEPKRRDLSIPGLRDKVVQLVIHEELQNIFRPVFIDGSFACQYGRGPIRAALKVQHDMRVARMKWGDDVAVSPEVLLLHRPRPAQENPCEAVQEAQEEAPRHVRGSPSVLPASLQSD